MTLSKRSNARLSFEDHMSGLDLTYPTYLLAYYPILCTLAGEVQMQWSASVLPGNRIDHLTARGSTASYNVAVVSANKTLTPWMIHHGFVITIKRSAADIYLYKYKSKNEYMMIKE